MRKFLFFLFTILALFSIELVKAQTPQCSVAGTFTNRVGDQTDGVNNIAVAAGIASSIDYNNINAHCTGWVFSYTSDGFSAVSVHFESAAGSNTAHGVYGDFAGTVVSGTNPATATTSSVIVATGYYPWMRVRLASSTGTGLIIWHMDGYVNLNQVSQRGGGSGLTPIANNNILCNGTGSSANPIACAPGFGFTWAGGVPAVDTAALTSNSNNLLNTCHYLTSTTTNTTYVASLASGCLALDSGPGLVAGEQFILNVDTTCSTSCTLKIDAAAAKNVKKLDGTTDPNGTLILNQPQVIEYNGTVFLLLGPAPYSAPGATVTITGCGTISAQAGGTLTGVFTTNTTGTCTPVFTSLPTATNGYVCLVQDITKHVAANIMMQSASSTTSCTATGTTAASDVLTYTLIPY